MQGDIYSNLAALFSPAGGGLRLRLGQVLTVSPLSVEVCGTRQEAQRLRLTGRLRTVLSVGLSVEGEASGGAVTYNGVSGALSGRLSLDGSGTLTLPGLAPGDQLLLLTEDDQIFYIIDKVVSA